MSLFSYTYRQWTSLPTEGDAVRKERIWRSIDRERNRARRRHLLFRGLVTTVSMAACLLVGIWAGTRLQRKAAAPVPDNQYVWVVADNGAQLLPDGSRVWMDGGSRLRYSDRFSEDRQVWLDGSASFEVVRQEDAARFVVNLPEGYVEVHGTSFSVRQDLPGTVAVALYEGAVDFVTEQERVSLEPLQQLVCSGGQVEVTPFFDHARWSSGRFKLENMPLREVLAFVHWKYGVDITLPRRFDDGGAKVTGIIGHDESLESVLDKVGYVFGLRYRRDGQTYQLYL